MLSGVGPAKTLKKHDIPVIADLAGVGQNLEVCSLPHFSGKGFLINGEGPRYNLYQP